jgi:uncharacterized RDD family membrane protein YckC
MNDPNQINPFAAPLSDTEGASEHVPDGSDFLATRGERFLGAMIDGLLYIPGVLIAGFGAFNAIANRSLSNLGAVAFIGVAYCIALWIYQMVLVSRTGQTIGKRTQRTRIVLMNGAPVSFFSAVFMRAWVPVLASFALGVICAVASIPSEVSNRIGNLWSLADALAIFGASHRCLHDLIAGTKVVKVRAGDGLI